MRIAKAIRPTSRRSGVRLVGALGRWGPRGPPGRRVVRSFPEASSVGGSSSKKSKSMSVSFSLSGEVLQRENLSPLLPRSPGLRQESDCARPRKLGVSWPRQRLPFSTSDLVAERYRPLRPLGSGGSGLGLARPRRAERPRCRPEDRPSRGEGGDRAPSGKRWRPRGCGTSAACAPTGSNGTRATSTSPTSTCRVGPCARLRAAS